jgi:DNA mismatch repair protein MutS2
VKPEPKPGFRPQVGDRVRIPRLGQTAEVLTAPDANDEITVRFGLMKMTVSLQDVESLTGEKPVIEKKPEKIPETGDKSKGKGRESQEQTPAPTTVPTVRTSQNTIDIRGSRVADAEITLDLALSEAQRTGGALWIIHGHGTGKLRQGVHAFLQQHPLVDRYELAPREEGGSGVTIAYLH